MGTEQQQYLRLFGLLLPHSSLCAYTCDKAGGTITGLLFFWTVPDTYANSPVPHSIFRVSNHFPPVLSQFATKNQKFTYPFNNKSLSESLYFAIVLQDWLTESARLISKCGHTVEWVTPLGLPIIQPYHRTRNQVVSHVFFFSPFWQSSCFVFIIIMFKLHVI